MANNENAAAQAGDGRPGVRVVAFEGDLDLENLEPLKNRLEHAAEAAPAVVLDASEITFGDSSFLRVLLSVHERTDLRIAAPRPVLERLIGLVGMDRVLKIYPSVAEAEAAPLSR